MSPISREDGLSNGRIRLLAHLTNQSAGRLRGIGVVSEISDLPRPHTSVALPDGSGVRQPLWPALVIGLAAIVTCLWSAALLWLLSRMLLS